MITKELLEEKHNAKDYLDWVKILIDNFKQENDISAYKFPKGIVKNLREESLPLGYLASNYYNESEDVSISLKVGNQTYDAVVEDSRNGASDKYHVEITLAHDGENQHLKELYLHENGELSFFGNVTKEGTKNTGLRINVVGKAISQEDVLKYESKLIDDAIARKLHKPYPRNSLLLIAFDDIMAFDRPDNIKNITAVPLRTK